jgi:membrane protein implicated in regulation of membrane protease activity
VGERGKDAVEWDSQWLWWLAAALAAGVIEVATVDFIFLMIGGGALIASVSAAFGVPFAIQVIVFAISTAAMLAVVRPPLKAWATRTPQSHTGTRALVGREARVVERVTEHAGLVKLAGENWTARSDATGQVLEVGSTVRVVRIEGATAVVAVQGDVGPEREGIEQ